MININLFEKYLDSFISLTDKINYLDNGIFDSELFVIYSLFKELNCNLLIESGICYGYSTEILLSSINADHHGVELSSDYIDFGQSIEKKYSNFKFYNQDSFLIIPKIIEQNKNKNIFINIDGPKNNAAIKLKNEVMSFDNVKAVSVHDHTEENSDKIFSTKNNKKFNEIYFDILNKKQKNKKHSTYNNNSYAEVYPFGPGLTVYIK